MGLKCQDLISDESRQCQGCVGVLIYHQYTVTFIQDINCIFNIYGPYLICKCTCTFTYRNSSPSLIIQFHQNNPQMLFHIIVSLRGAGAFSMDFTTNLTPQSRAFSRALKIEKLQAPQFLGLGSAVDTNDWCIIWITTSSM